MEPALHVPCAILFAPHQPNLASVEPLDIFGVLSRLGCTSVALPTFGRSQTKSGVSAASVRSPCWLQGGVEGVVVSGAW